MIHNSRVPVTTVEELDQLNNMEVFEGYQDGLENFRCGENRSRAYWHGWRNGQVDGGHAQKDRAQEVLAQEDAIRRWRKSLQ
jgi:hypothetical protein